MSENRTRFRLDQRRAPIYEALEQFRQIAEYCLQNKLPLRFVPVPKDELDRMLHFFPGSTAQADRDTFDYLYRSEDLKFFRGKKLSGQRNHVNRFHKTYGTWTFRPIVPEDLPMILALLDRYVQEHEKDSVSYLEDLNKTKEVLNNLDLYDMKGGLLMVEDRLAGFSLGEVLGDTLFIHIEKADIAYEGVYQALVNEYAKCFVTPGVRYINREEDAGDEGLRRSKESYHPVRLLEKYLVQIPAQPEKGDKSMQEVYEFLKKCGTYYLATVDGDQPRVRPFGTVNLFEGNLYIQTGKVKAVSREMTANPKVELCAFDGETWLRVSAKAVEDDRVQARQDLLDHYPELQSLYTADDGNTQVFALTEATATFSSFQAAPRVVRW